MFLLVLLLEELVGSADHGQIVVDPELGMRMICCRLTMRPIPLLHDIESRPIRVPMRVPHVHVRFSRPSFPCSRTTLTSDCQHVPPPFPSQSQAVLSYAVDRTDSLVPVHADLPLHGCTIASVAPSQRSPSDRQPSPAIDRVSGMPPSIVSLHFISTPLGESLMPDACRVCVLVNGQKKWLTSSCECRLR